MRPRHVVLATGVSGIPNVPDIPALEGFTGKVIHSGEYVDGEDWRGKRAVVIGTGNSGHDIAQDLYSAGAQVTLVQRSPTLIIQCDPSAQLVYSLYSEGPPLEDCDLITVSVPLALAKRTHQLATAHARTLDRELLDALERKGFRLDFGEDGTGWQFKYLTRGGGYYFNVGCSDLIVEGKIGLAQFRELERLLPGTDLVVLATGWKGQEALVGKLFGPEVAQRVGPMWGFRRGPGAAQHVPAHRAAGPVVHRRQLRAVPDLLAVSGAADSSNRSRAVARQRLVKGYLRLTSVALPPWRIAAMPAMTLIQ